MEIARGEKLPFRVVFVRAAVDFRLAGVEPDFRRGAIEGIVLPFHDAVVAVRQRREVADGIKFIRPGCPQFVRFGGHPAEQIVGPDGFVADRIGQRREIADRVVAELRERPGSMSQGIHE